MIPLNKFSVKHKRIKDIGNSLVFSGLVESISVNLTESGNWVSGKDIILSGEGIVDSGWEDRALIALAHEVGHILTPNKHHKIWGDVVGWVVNDRDRDSLWESVTYFERLAWGYGLVFFHKEYSVVFEEDTLEWAIDQLNTYRNYKG